MPFSSRSAWSIVAFTSCLVVSVIISVVTRPREDRELEGLELGTKIQSQVQSEMEHSQREYFLREQLKAIQKELGELDERAEEVTEFRKRIKDAKMPEKVLKEAEKQLKRLLGRGNPDASAIRVGYANMRPHLEYLGWLAETRPWLAGSRISLADFAAAGHLSALDYIGDVDWTQNEAAKQWYARMKSRPSFRALLAERVSGLEPPPHYDDPDF